MKLINEIKVSLDFGEQPVSVGRLAIRNGQIYFEYDSAFIESGLDISPFKLPLQSGVTSFDRHLFEGIAGVFNDSLPDGWGRLLLDRSLRLQDILPEDLSPLDRLANVGNSAIGALIYQPDYSEKTTDAKLNLDVISAHTRDVINGDSRDVLQELLALNGSSAGARPKAMIGVDAERKNITHGNGDLPENYQHWLVKFANSTDGSDSGAVEYVYAIMAQNSGVKMSDTHLFPAENGAGYFATKRFDRDGKNRLHTHTACGLLHSDFRTPSLDYEDLLTLTFALTKDIREVKKMFRLAVFNVLSHNRDDHSKNFTFLMDATAQWKLSPAYDLTFSSGPNGEQSMMVMGEGKNPTAEHLMKLGKTTKLDDGFIAEVIEQTQTALNNWKSLATEHGISKTNIALIEKRLQVK
jgi:serine/threonine-protein kinase HipA